MSKKSRYTNARTMTFAPLNFETETLEEGLRRVAFDAGRCTFFSWLGVTSNITNSAFTATLGFVASRPSGSRIVFDYMISPSLLNPTARNVFDNLAHRVALAGEPFQNFFDPALLKNDLKTAGLRQIEDLAPGKLNDLYFHGLTDELKVGSLAHIINAMV